ncbi:MAG: mechanosensitive ion channel [Candidatus Saganbacteria bacterium]|nr:mechanosensitive ion channel [Candidatus Saganbacteria bacterium]
MIVIFQTFEVGDTIETSGVSGVVEEIQIFSTTLKTADNKRKIIPNPKTTSDIITLDLNDK